MAGFFLSARARAGKVHGAASRWRRRLRPPHPCSETRASARRSSVSVSSALGISAAGGGPMTTTNSPRISCRGACARTLAAAADFFVQLGQLATEGGFARPSPVARSASGGNPRPGLEQYDGGRHAREFGDARPARPAWAAGSWRIKLIRGLARDCQGSREHGRRLPQRRNGMARILSGAHQACILDRKSVACRRPTRVQSRLPARPSRRSAGRAWVALWSW